MYLIKIYFLAIVLIAFALVFHGFSETSFEMFWLCAFLVADFLRGIVWKL